MTVHNYRVSEPKKPRAHVPHVLAIQHFSPLLLQLHPYYTNQHDAKASNECKQNQYISVVTVGVKAKQLAGSEQLRSKYHRV